MDNQVNFTEIEEIDRGGFGIVVKAVDPTNRKIAVKYFHSKKNSKHECKVLTKLKSVKGIPKKFFCSHTEKEPLIGMELLGQNLNKYFESINLSNFFKIAKKAINILKKVHNKGYTHNDIKPDQFLFNADMSELFLIDWGLATKFINKDGKHKSLQQKGYLGGNCVFSSISNHECYKLTRRDDILSLTYMIIYLIKKSLPWTDLKFKKSPKKRWHAVHLMKISMSSEDICKDLPNEFKSILDYSRSLKYDEEPDYNYIIKTYKMAYSKADTNHLEKHVTFEESVNKKKQIEKIFNTTEIIEAPSFIPRCFLTTEKMF